MSDSVQPHRRQPTRLHRPWDSPGKNTAVGCHFPLQCVKVKSESKVTQSCQTLCDPMDRSLPGSSTHGILQARVLEWVAIAFSASTYEADAVIIFILKAEKNEALINLLKVTSQVAASGFKPRSSTVEPVLLTIGVLA